MARKPQPKPLFEVKGDFYASLDNFVAKSVALHLVVKSALDLDCIDGRVKSMVADALAELDAAMSPSAENARDGG